VERALDYLRSHGGYTLPTCGIIGKQTIAGAIATATHGSGRASLSGYVIAATVAGYDGDSGKARTFTWKGGADLLAARCGLGCAGILLSVRIPVEPDFLIEEETVWFDRIEDALGTARGYPRQQFYLIPWSWKWYVQLRRPRRDTGARISMLAPVFRVFRAIVVDIVFNGVVRLTAGLRWWAAIRWIYRRGFQLIARPKMHVIDCSRHLLMMRHDLYAHVEMELFVRTQYVSRAAAFVEWVLRRRGGEFTPLPETVKDDRFGQHVEVEIDTLKGRYVHDYVITFRRVLREETLISMTSGDTDAEWYAISLITYRRDLDPFLKVMEFLAATMASAYGARPHWGKVCPLNTRILAALYPALPQFRLHCASVDPQQAFVNDFARRALGF
jgi:hypothetical protein